MRHNSRVTTTSKTTFISPRSKSTSLDDDEEIAYPGLNAFLENLHAGWAATDNIGPVEPGAYYPPPRDGTTVVEVTMMDID